MGKGEWFIYIGYFYMIHYIHINTHTGREQCGGGEISRSRTRTLSRRITFPDSHSLSFLPEIGKICQDCESYAQLPNIETLALDFLVQHCVLFHLFAASPTTVIR
jgi:hypothetical protein